VRFTSQAHLLGHLGKELVGRAVSPDPSPLVPFLDRMHETKGRRPGYSFGERVNGCMPAMLECLSYTFLRDYPLGSTTDRPGSLPYVLEDGPELPKVP
jgi:hypothetical protein